MKPAGIIAIAVLAIAAVSVADFADAKRLSGGRSIGAQRQSIAPTKPTPPTAAPASPAAPSAAQSAAPSGAAANPVMPATAGAAAAKAAAPAAAKSGLSKWMGPLAGLAAGIGLAALLSHLGLSGEFASLLLIAALVIGAVLLVRMLMARRTPLKPAMQYAGPAGLDTKPGGYETQPAPGIAGASRVEPTIAAAPVPSANFARPLPEGFDAAAFVAQAKLQFRRLQDAFDRGDRKLMGDVMTNEMLAEVLRDFDARDPHRATVVDTLDAEVLEVHTEGRTHWASVRFTGSLREDDSVMPTPFDEVWNLTKPVDGSTGWLLAGIEQVATA